MKKTIANILITLLLLIFCVIIIYTKKSSTNSNYHFLILFKESFEFHIKKDSVLKKCNSIEERKAALWLLENMRSQFSYNNTISQNYFKHLLMNKTVDYKHLWLYFNSHNTNMPQLTADIKNIDSNDLIKNIRKALWTWNKSPWKNEISFECFCKYILPYKISTEPFYNWRTYYWNKYSFLLKGVTNKKVAFQKIFEYEKKHFPIKNTYFPYEQDPILLDALAGGNCRQRAFHMTYVMRALGLPVATDYTPLWANYGENGHYWVSLIDENNKVIIPNNIIDGVYEKSIINYNKDIFSCSIDSLKKISKIYRLTYEEIKPNINSKEIIRYVHLNSTHTTDVTYQYHGVTQNNIIDFPSSIFSKYYVCTFSQKEGWVPMGKAKRINNEKMDIGPLYNDNIIVIAKYKDGDFIPISDPYLIRHHKKPFKLEPNYSRKNNVILHRKYLLRTTWINRWSEVIGTKIETSCNSNFKSNCYTISIINKLPNTEIININLENNIKNYIRILPKTNVFPVFAELRLFDRNNKIINPSLYHIFAIGNTLTGDSLVTKKLQDGKLSTTFYKRFPFWIGFKIDKIKKQIKRLQIIMWNDENQIQFGHNYELLYFTNGKWHSLGRKRASSYYIEFEKVPRNALLLLKDLSKGKEERIFLYINNKQIWY